MNPRESPTAALDISLDTPLPKAVGAGFPTAAVCVGSCSQGGQPVTDLCLLVNGARHRPTAQGMPREDRDVYSSGFWATVPIEATGPGPIDVEAEARTAEGTLGRAAIGSIEVLAEPEKTSLPEPKGSDRPLIAICMATYNSDPDLFRIQVDSVRAQTDEGWICLISDDCSDPARFQLIEEIVAGDDRFVLTRSEQRLGFYRNFERLVSILPEGAELVALADHDDRWYPEKLAALREALGDDAELAYSDLRLVDKSGNVRAHTFWEGRQNNFSNLASLLVSNTVPGAACLMRRRAVARALPFPGGPGWDFHDHWLALVALSMGSVAYVDRPLYDYVQHPGAVLGRIASEPEASQERRSVSERISSRRGFLARWRRAYFTAYLQRELMATILLARCGAEMGVRKRRALELMIRAQRSSVAFAWLATRSLRAVRGHNETLGVEWLLAKGILWRSVMSLRARYRRPGGPIGDASLPSFDSKSLGQSRRRWLSDSR